MRRIKRPEPHDVNFEKVYQEFVGNLDKYYEMEPSSVYGESMKLLKRVEPSRVDIESIPVEENWYSGIFLSAAINKSNDNKFKFSHKFHENLSYLGMFAKKPKKIVAEVDLGDYTGYALNGGWIEAMEDTLDNSFSYMRSGLGRVHKRSRNAFCEYMRGGHVQALGDVTGRGTLHGMADGTVMFRGDVHEFDMGPRGGRIIKMPTLRPNSPFRLM